MKPHASAAATTTRIVLADDHDLVRSGIKALLALIEGVEVIAEARDGRELVTLVDSLKPDVVMTDISMPGMDGIAAISEIHARHADVRLLVLSMYDTVDFVKRAVASGACGYLMKDAPPFELEQAIRSVMATGSYFSLRSRPRLPGLRPPTERYLTVRGANLRNLQAIDVSFPLSRLTVVTGAYALGPISGGHFNPAGTPHGQHAMGQHHAGDLPSLKADAAGVAMDTAGKAVLGTIITILVAAFLGVMWLGAKMSLTTTGAGAP